MMLRPFCTLGTSISVNGFRWCDWQIPDSDKIEINHHGGIKKAAGIGGRKGNRIIFKDSPIDSVRGSRPVLK